MGGGARFFFRCVSAVFGRPPPQSARRAHVNKLVCRCVCVNKLVCRCVCTHFSLFVSSGGAPVRAAHTTQEGRPMMLPSTTLVCASFVGGALGGVRHPLTPPAPRALSVSQYTDPPPWHPGSMDGLAGEGADTRDPRRHDGGAARRGHRPDAAAAPPRRSPAQTQGGVRPRLWIDDAPSIPCCTLPPPLLSRVGAPDGRAAAAPPHPVGAPVPPHGADAQSGTGGGDAG